MSYTTVYGWSPEGVPYREAQSCLTPTFANSTYQFFLTGTSTPANVYQDGALTNPFPITGFVTSDNYGRFPPIYLDTSIIYRVQFYDNTNTLRWTVDPYTPPLATVGTSANVAYGFQIATTGEVTLDAPITGGTGTTLTLVAGAIGSTPLKITGTLAGNSAIIVNSSATTGAHTATFNANNKPGTPPTSYSLTLTTAPSGSTYTGGTLSPAFTGPANTNYTVTLSTGQNLYNVTLNGTTLSVASTVITGTPTTAITAMTPVTPAGWLPITCDGVQYYTPIWHGNNFSPYFANPSAGGQTINASTVAFFSNGTSGATGGTVSPSNWFSPSTPSIGANYYINITKTGGLSGLAFSVAQGTWTNISSGGLSIGSNGQAAITGTYQLSTSITGSPVAASGTITLSNNNGVQSPSYNGTTPLVLAANGTSELGGTSNLNWYAPTTANVGAGYYIFITQTGGTAGYSFSTATSAPVNITNAGLSIGISGSGAVPYSVTGIYTISSDSAGTVQLGRGTITLSGGTDVQSPNWSGTTPLNLAGNGTATLNGTSTSNWYAPTTANVGAGYYINITRTGGTSGVNFSVAQGSWTIITNTGRTIDMTGYTGDVGTATVNGNYQISSSVSGTPVLGSGTLSLSVSGLTVIHVYTNPVTSATETIPTGTTNVYVEVWGSGGGGGGGYNASKPNYSGGGGGAGGFSYSVYSAAALGGAGGTFKYTVPAGGAGGASAGAAGQNGAAGTVAAGTVSGFTAMTANAGEGGDAGTSGGNGSNGVGGTATGGNNTNTTGATGGGSGTAGKITGDGSPYGGGGEGVITYGQAGAGGAVVFRYT